MPPMMLRVDERGIKRREIRQTDVPTLIEPAFEGAEGCIKPEAAQHDDDGYDLSPPRVAAFGGAESAVILKHMQLRQAWPPGDETFRARFPCGTFISRCVL